jgi:CRISPR-associated protein Csy2
MMKCPKFEHLLVIPHLRVQNANAVSSPLTHGFPSMTAFLGLMWALERKTAAQGLDVRFKAVGVVCHDYQEQVSNAGFAHSFCLTRNPSLDKKRIKDGKIVRSDAIVEEGRIHLDISLIFALRSKTLTHAFASPEIQEKIAADVYRILESMRIAGGSILPYSLKPYFIALTGADKDREQCFFDLKYRLLPGFTLVARDDLLEKRHKKLQAKTPESSRLDAWLSLSRFNWRCATPLDKKPAEWEHDNPGGWLSPIPVGYSVLSRPHDPVASARDAKTPFRFVESIYSIGEWIGPHRLRDPKEMLWYAEHAPDTGLYRCCNDYQHKPDIPPESADDNDNADYDFV